MRLLRGCISVDRLIFTLKNVPWLEWVSRMSGRRTWGMFLRGGSKFELFHRNEKGKSGSSCLQGVLFFSYFPFISISSSVSGAASQTLAHCLERRFSYSAALCCRVKWTRQITYPSFGDIFWSQELSRAMKMPLLPTPTVASIRPSNQMQLVDLNNFLSMHSRAREPNCLCYCALE